jgi:hypothetical protein
MQEIIKEIEGRLQADLAACGEEVNALKRLELSKQVTRKAIIALENLLGTSAPLDDDDLVQYNKVWAPPFYGKLILFEKCSHVEGLKLSYAAEERANLFAHEMITINHFFRRNGNFCEYYYSGATDRDATYFEKMDGIYLPVVDIPLGFSGKQNKGCILVAHILAYEAYRKYLTGQDREGDVLAVDRNLQWMGTKADLVELIIALLDFVHLDGKPISRIDLERFFETQFKISLKDSGTIDHKNRNRKKDPAAFLTKLKEVYLRRQEHLEGDRYRA